LDDVSHAPPIWSRNCRRHLCLQAA